MRLRVCCVCEWRSHVSSIRMIHYNHTNVKHFLVKMFCLSLGSMITCEIATCMCADRRLSTAQSGPEGEGVVHSAAVHAGAYQLTVLLYDLARSSTNSL